MPEVKQQPDQLPIKQEGEPKDNRDHYEVLGIGKTAKEDELKKAYRDLAMKHHPDRNPGDDEAAKEFKKAKKAYEILSDKESREIYDDVYDVKNLTDLAEKISNFKNLKQWEFIGEETDPNTKQLVDKVRNVKQEMPDILKMLDVALDEYLEKKQSEITSEEFDKKFQEDWGRFPEYGGWLEKFKSILKEEYRRKDKIKEGAQPAPAAAGTSGLDKALQDEEARIREMRELSAEQQKQIEELEKGLETKKGRTDKMVEGMSLASEKNPVGELSEDMQLHGEWVENKAGDFFEFVTGEELEKTKMMEEQSESLKKAFGESSDARESLEKPLEIVLIDKKNDFYQEVKRDAVAKTKREAKELYDGKDAKVKYKNAKFEGLLKQAKKTEDENVIMYRWENMDKRERGLYGGDFNTFKKDFKDKLGEAWGYLEAKGFKISQEAIYGLIRGGYRVERFKKELLFGRMVARKDILKKDGDGNVIESTVDIKKLLPEAFEKLCKNAETAENNFLDKKARKELARNYGLAKKRFGNIVEKNEGIMTESVFSSRIYNATEFADIYETLQMKGVIKGPDGKNYKADNLSGFLMKGEGFVKDEKRLLIFLRYFGERRDGNREVMLKVKQLFEEKIQKNKKGEREKEIEDGKKSEEFYESGKTKKVKYRVKKEAPVKKASPKKAKAKEEAEESIEEKPVEMVTNPEGVQFPKDFYAKLVKYGYEPDRAYMIQMNAFGKKEDADELRIPSLEDKKEEISIKGFKGKTAEERLKIIKKALSERLEKINEGASSPSLKVESKKKSKGEFGFGDTMKARKDKK